MRINNIKPNIYQRLANKIEKSPRLQNILKKVDSNPSLANGMFVCATAVLLKPTTIMAIPTKDKDSKEDAIYSSAKSIGTGFVDLAIAYLLFVPINKHLDKVGRKIFNEADSVYFHNKERCSAYKSIFNRVAKIALLPIFAWAKFAFITPLAERYKKYRSKHESK